MNPLLIVWDLQELAVKPFAHFSHEILIVLNFQEAVVKPFGHFWGNVIILMKTQLKITLTTKTESHDS